MITTIDIIFREFDKIVFSRFLSSLSLSAVDLPKHPVLVPSCGFFLLTLICWAFSRPWISNDNHNHTRIALQALVTVVVPTCSLWPSNYIKPANLLPSRIDIPLEEIIKDTINGVVEFRDPINGLVDLIGPGITVNGCTVRINIGWGWRFKCFEWWMLAKEAPSGRFKSGHTSGLLNRLHSDLPATSSSSLDLSLTRPFALPPSTSRPLLCLDFLPRDVISTLNAGCKVTLEFTTFSPSLQALSTAQVISSIPFMVSGHPRRHPRPLVSVLKQLKALFGINTVIDSLSNVSVDYGHALYHAHKSLSGEQMTRETWVKTQGIKAWRREIFLVALEAALVRRGWIERWAVQLTVR